MSRTTTMPFKCKDKKTLCSNSEISENLAFSFLGFRDENRIVSESELALIYRRQRVPDSIFKTDLGNVAVEVKRVKNVIHKDTVINALEKINTAIVYDFKLKHFYIVFQTRESGQRDSVNNIIRDVHGILKKILPSIPYKAKNGVKIYVHVQKVGDLPFENIGF